MRGTGERSGGGSGNRRGAADRGATGGGDRHPAGVGHLFESARGGDRAALARLISLIERGEARAREVGALAYPLAGDAYTVGITGAPGSGKSTLTSGIIQLVLAAGDQSVAVIAIDPTSPFTGGAILGDRVRMQEHSTDPRVFIRSMATRGHFGGLSLAVPEAIRLLDAVGLPLVLLETVGVGQVEVRVAATADTTVVVVNPGWGDAVQANKAGLLEIADVFAVNKADRPGAAEAQRDLEAMLDLAPPRDWRPPVVLTTAPTGEGLEELWNEIVRHRQHLSEGRGLGDRRAARLEEEVTEIVGRRLAGRAAELWGSPEAKPVRDDLAGRRIDPHEAADRLLSGI